MVKILTLQYLTICQLVPGMIAPISAWYDRAHPDMKLFYKFELKNDISGNIYTVSGVFNHSQSASENSSQTRSGESVANNSIQRDDSIYRGSAHKGCNHSYTLVKEESKLQIFSSLER